MLPVVVNDGVGSHVAFVASLMLFVVMVIIYDPGGRHMKVMVLQLEPGGGYSHKNLVGVCGPLPKTLTQFMTKIWDFSYLIYDLTTNLIPYL